MLNQWNFGFLFTAQDQASAVINRVNGNLLGLRQSASDTGAGVESSFKRIGLAAGALYASVKALKAFGDAVRSYTDFQKGMAEVSTLVDTTRVSMDKLESKVLSLSARFGELPVDVAKAMYTTISSGFTDDADAARVLEGAMKLAVGGVTDVNTALDGLTSILNAFGYSTKETTRVTNAMFAAMRAGKTTIGELAGSIGQVAPFAAQAGVSIEETLSAISALTLGGLQTSEAATAVRSMLVAVIRQSPQAVKEAKKLGIEFSASAIRAMGLQKWLAHVAEKLNGDEKAAARLFGRVEALTAIFQLTGKQAKNFNDILATMKKGAPETETAFNKMANTMSFQLKRLKAQWEVLKIAIGKALAPIVAFFAKGLNAIVNFFVTLKKNHPILFRTISLVAGVTAGVVALGSALVLLKLVFGGVATAAMAAFAPMLPVIAAVVGAITAIVVAIEGVKVAYETNFAGFRGLIDSIAKAWNDFVNGIKEGWKQSGIEEFVNDVIPMLKQAFKEAFTAIENALRPVVKAFSSAIGETTLFSKAGITLGKILGTIFKALGAAIAIWVRKFALMLEVAGHVLRGIVYLVKAVVKVFKGDFEGALEDVKSALGAFGDVFGAVMRFVKDTFFIVGRAIGLTSQQIGMAWDWLVSKAVAVWQGIVNMFKAVGSFFASVGSYIKQVFVDIFNWVVEQFNKLIEWIKNLPQRLWKSAKSAVTGAFDWVGSKVGKAVDFVIGEEGGGGTASTGTTGENVKFTTYATSPSNVTIVQQAQKIAQAQGEFKATVTVPNIQVQANLHVDGRQIASTIDNVKREDSEATYEAVPNPA